MRPRMVSWVSGMHQYTGDEWVEVGTVMHVGNLGRSPLPVELAGRISTDDSLGPMPLVFRANDFERENPSFPLSLQPGEFMSVWLDPAADPAALEGYAVHQVRIAWWDRLRRKPRMTRKRVIVRELKAPEVVR